MAELPASTKGTVKPLQASDKKRLAQGLQTSRRAAEAGDLATAKRNLAPLFQSYPGHPDLLQMMGQVAHLEGRSELALNLIGQAIAKNGQIASYHFSLGMVLSDIEQLDGAEIALRRAIELQPNMQWALIRLGTVLRGKRQYEEGRSILNRVLNDAPDNPDALLHLATLEIDAGEFETALPLLETLKASQVHQFAAWEQIAHARLSLGDIEQAASSWREALKINPGAGNAYRQVVNTRRYKKADDPDILAVRRAALQSGL